jgi:hypothetical protein
MAASAETRKVAPYNTEPWKFVDERS